jgi:hypothetical protein
MSRAQISSSSWKYGRYRGESGILERPLLQTQCVRDAKNRSPYYHLRFYQICNIGRTRNVGNQISDDWGIDGMDSLPSYATNAGASLFSAVFFGPKPSFNQQLNPFKITELL